MDGNAKKHSNKEAFVVNHKIRLAYMYVNRGWRAGFEMKGHFITVDDDSNILVKSLMRFLFDMYQAICYVVLEHSRNTDYSSRSPLKQL